MKKATFWSFKYELAAQKRLEIRADKYRSRKVSSFSFSFLQTSWNKSMFFMPFAMIIPGEVAVNKYIFCLEWWFPAVDSTKKDFEESNKVIQAINCILKVKTRMCTFVPIKNQHSKS